jgi:hypothetical protein
VAASEMARTTFAFREKSSIGKEYDNELLKGSVQMIPGNNAGAFLRVESFHVGQKEQSSDRDSWHALSRFLGNPVNQTQRTTRSRYIDR